MPEFQRFDPAACHFPSPRVPLLPSLRWSDIALNGERTDTERIAFTSVRHFARGRYAMHAAYQAAGVGPTGMLLAPAYHCRTMLDPALALGGSFALYRLNGDLTPQLDSIRALVVSSMPTVKALVVTHYFGVAQPQALMQDIAALCSAHGITLVEDCSHAWLIAAKRAAAVQTAQRHFLIASPYKFFACDDGGTLWCNPARLPPAPLQPPGWLAEAKALVHAVQRGLAARRFHASVQSTHGAVAVGHVGEDITELSSSHSGMYDERSEKNSSLAFSRWVMRHTRLGPLMQQRRENYGQWAKVASGLRGARALYPALPADCAPYMFALRIDCPEPHFYQLKHLGLPIWRWDEMALSDCPVATDYRLHLLHLPCHQSLSAAQMGWMTDVVSKVLA